MRYFKKGDIIIILIFLLFSFLFSLMFSGSSGEKVCIFSDGQLYGEYDIKKDSEIKIKYNNDFNNVVIKNKEVFVSDASCRDKLDVKQGRISKSGQSIICLPNKLIVYIKGESKFDALSY